MIASINKKGLRAYKDRLNILLNLAQTINEDYGTDDLMLEFEKLLSEELEVGKILVFTFADGKWSNILKSGVSEQEANNIDVHRDLLQYTKLENITLDPPENLKGFDAIIPLVHRSEIIAYVLIGDVDEEITGISPTIKHLKLIQIIANLIIVFIENKRMHKVTIEQEAMKKELELASNIQTRLISGEQDLPKFKEMAIHTIYQPHLGVGGDYFDIISLSHNTMGFCIADVSGKGIGAALLMSNFQAFLRSLFTPNIGLKKLVKILNEKVNESTNNDQFITIFIGKYNFSTRRLTYVNAAHLPPLFYDIAKQKLSFLENGCIGLGMLDVIPKINQGQIVVPHKSKLIAFTDGLVEIESDDHQINIGMDSLIEAISNNDTITENIQQIRKIIDNNVTNDRFFDDISLIGIGFE